MTREVIARPYDPLPWYGVKVGDSITYRSPFTGPHCVRVVERQSARVMKVMLEDGNEKWLVTDNLTLEKAHV